MPDRNEEARRSPEQQLRALYDDAESRTATAFEEAVSKPSFGALLAHTAENVAAITRIGNDMADLVLRNLRVAGRADITRLARQLHRTEDKLERVLQEVERLGDELTQERARSSRSSGNGRSSSAARSSGGGRSTAGTRRRSSSAKS
jgi:hypothetical protein